MVKSQLLVTLNCCLPISCHYEVPGTQVTGRTSVDPPTRGSAVLCASFFPSIFLTSAWIQLHKDVIALTVCSWDSPSKVGESPDQSKAKLALVNPMAFLSLF
ncbi:hypothetical protein H0E87_011439 [Populus deltoides]|uniref:Uncharacterized protein n=1 Tax=Populus deltoides TaxID=3696 RepID=A0A8T2YX07_POPDE|nr:hypothetical protein H0E87_011439 [Populus deltoides]